MAKILIDGEYHEIEQSLEDAAYGEEPNVIVCDSEEEFNAAKDEYQEDQRIASLQYTEGMMSLLLKAEREAVSAAQTEIAYEADDDKSKKLKLNRIKTKAILEWLRSTVEQASFTPRPILRNK